MKSGFISKEFEPSHDVVLVNFFLFRAKHIKHVVSTFYQEKMTLYSKAPQFLMGALTYARWGDGICCSMDKHCRGKGSRKSFRSINSIKLPILCHERQVFPGFECIWEPSITCGSFLCVGRRSCGRQLWPQKHLICQWMRIIRHISKERGWRVPDRVHKIFASVKVENGNNRIRAASLYLQMSIKTRLDWDQVYRTANKASAAPAEWPITVIRVVSIWITPVSWRKIAGKEETVHLRQSRESMTGPS